MQKKQTDKIILKNHSHSLCLSWSSLGQRAVNGYAIVLYVASLKRWRKILSLESKKMSQELLSAGWSILPSPLSWILLSVLLYTDLLFQKTRGHSPTALVSRALGTLNYIIFSHRESLFMKIWCGEVPGSNGCHQLSLRSSVCKAVYPVLARHNVQWVCPGLSSLP